MGHAILVHIIIHVCKKFHACRNLAFQQLFDTEILCLNAVFHRHSLFIHLVKEINQTHIEVYDTIIRILHSIVLRYIASLLCCLTLAAAEQEGYSACLFIVSDKIQDCQILLAGINSQTTPQLLQKYSR